MIGTLFLNFLLVTLLFSGSLFAQNLHQPPATLQQPSSAMEITTTDYCGFLNAVAATDPDNLYDEKMAANLAGAGVVRAGEPGSYHYADQTRGSETAAIVTFISYENAVQYCNWKSHSLVPNISFNVDLQLKSNLLKIDLSSVELNKETAEKNSTTLSNLTLERVVFGGLLTIVSIFSDSFRTPETPSAPRIVEVNKTSGSLQIGESRTSSEQQLVEQGIILQNKVNDAAAKTSFSHLREAAGHLMTGIGHGTALGLRATTPFINEGRHVTIGAVVGYGAGAFFSYLRGETPFEMMNDGAIGAVTGATLFWVENTYSSYRIWPSYCADLRSRYVQMKNSFAKILVSLTETRNVSARLDEAKADQTTFYRNLLDQYNEVDHVNIPEKLHSVLLRAQAYSEETDVDKKEKFIAMGNSFYGTEIMNYAFPESLRKQIGPWDVITFASQREEILTKMEALNSFSKTTSVSKYQAIQDYTAKQIANEDTLIATLKGEAAENNSLKQAGFQFGKGLRESAFVILRAISKPLIGICMGSFIGVALPLSYTLGDFSSAWLEDAMNITALTYGAHMLGIDFLSTARNRGVIRERASRAATAFSQAAKAWNRPTQIKAELKAAEMRLQQLRKDNTQ